MSKKLLFVVTEDWYFVSHRLPLAVAALEHGYDVVVATKIGKHESTIRAAGIRVIPLELSRRGGNPFNEIGALFLLYRRERPSLIHHVALKPVLFGSLAAYLARSPAQVNAIAGMGWLFTSQSLVVRLAVPLLRCLISRLLANPRSMTIIQNTEDRILLERAGVPPEHIKLIPGAGVDVNSFTPVPNLTSPPCVMLVARMLWDKGVAEFVEAARILWNAGVRARFVLVGDPDAANPASIPEHRLREWHGQYGIEWWGRREDMPTVWQSAHIACLPSYREGMPKSLLEAAACGLPIVTTDVPGCREAIVNGEDGFLVPAKDASALSEALRLLIEDQQRCKAMGAKARERAELIFSQEHVIGATLDTYREVLRTH